MHELANKPTRSRNFSDMVARPANITLRIMPSLRRIARPSTLFRFSLVSLCHPNDRFNITTMITNSSYPITRIQSEIFPTRSLILLSVSSNMQSIGYIDRNNSHARTAPFRRARIYGNSSECGACSNCQRFFNIVPLFDCSYFSPASVS